MAKTSIRFPDEVQKLIDNEKARIGRGASWVVVECVRRMLSSPYDVEGGQRWSVDDRERDLRAPSLPREDR